MNILGFIRSRPWWVWLLIAVFLFLLINEVTGAALTRKLWNQARDVIASKERAIAEDRARQVSDLNEQAKIRAAEVVRLQQREKLLKEKIDVLTKEKIKLQNDLDVIVANLPTDIDGLAKRFKERGYDVRIWRRGVFVLP